MRNVVSFVVALPSEARPIVDALRLQRSERTDNVKLYERENIRLIVSGIGKIASAAAVGYIAGNELTECSFIWINVGIAGHAHLPPGTVGIAHVVVDQATASTYYPAIAFPAPCESYALACFDKPTTSYAGAAMCDMESSGFCAAASRFSSVEFIHVLKVISDNSAGDIEALDRSAITTLIEGKLEIIEELAETLERLAERHLPKPIAMPLEALLERWRFTTTQRVQLRDLARRWALVCPESEWPPPRLRFCQSARDVITELTTTLDTNPLCLNSKGAK